MFAFYMPGLAHARLRGGKQQFCVFEFRKIFLQQRYKSVYVLPQPAFGTGRLGRVQHIRGRPGHVHHYSAVAVNTAKPRAAEYWNILRLSQFTQFCLDAQIVIIEPLLFMMDQLQSVRIHAADTKAQGRRLKRHCIFLHRHTRHSAEIAVSGAVDHIFCLQRPGTAFGVQNHMRYPAVLPHAACEHCVEMQINAALQQHPLRDQFIAFRIMGNIPQRMLYLRSVGFHHTLYEFPGNPPAYQLSVVGEYADRHYKGRRSHTAHKPIALYQRGTGACARSAYRCDPATGASPAHYNVIASHHRDAARLHDLFHLRITPFLFCFHHTLR